MIGWAMIEWYNSWITCLHVRVDVGSPGDELLGDVKVATLASYEQRGAAVLPTKRAW